MQSRTCQEKAKSKFDSLYSFLIFSSMDLISSLQLIKRFPVYTCFSFYFFNILYPFRFGKKFFAIPAVAVCISVPPDQQINSFIERLASKYRHPAAPQVFQKTWNWRLALLVPVRSSSKWLNGGMNLIFCISNVSGLLYLLNTIQRAASGSGNSRRQKMILTIY